MLIEIWERLRGYDKWIETEAKVESSKVKKTATYGNSWASEDELAWTDRSGKTQRARFNVPDGSPLFQLIGGETVMIQYDPTEPDRYYFRELFQTRARTAFKRTLRGLYDFCFIAFLFWEWVRHHQ